MALAQRYLGCFLVVLIAAVAVGSLRSADQAAVSGGRGTALDSSAFTAVDLGTVDNAQLEEMQGVPAGKQRLDLANHAPPESEVKQPGHDRPMQVPAENPLRLAKKEFLGLSPAQLAVTADPPRETFRYPEKLPYKALENVSASTVLYPPGQTAFLGAAKDGVDVESYKFYDLRTGKTIGQASDFSVRAEQGSVEGPAMSADGTYLAVPNSFEKQILVGNVRQRKGVAKLACDFFAPAVLFPSPTQLLVVDASSTKHAILWELPSGKQLRSFDLNDAPAIEAGKVLASPGGKYLAMVAQQSGADNEVQFYDLTNGKTAGALHVDVGRGMKARFNAIGFSTDGSEFAAFVHGVMNGQNAAEAMMVWDLASGRPVYQQFIEDGRRGGQGLGILATANRSEPLQWFPDGKGWLLFQTYVVDRDAAAVIQVVETPGEGLHSVYGTKILDDRRVLVADHDNKFRVVEVQRKRQP